MTLKIFLQVPLHPFLRQLLHIISLSIDSLVEADVCLECFKCQASPMLIAKYTANHAAIAACLHCSQCLELGSGMACVVGTKTISCSHCSTTRSCCDFAVLLCYFAYAMCRHISVLEVVEDLVDTTILDGSKVPPFSFSLYPQYCDLVLPNLQDLQTEMMLYEEHQAQIDRRALAALRGPPLSPVRSLLLVAGPSQPCIILCIPKQRFPNISSLPPSLPVNSSSSRPLFFTKPASKNCPDKHVSKQAHRDSGHKGEG